tara:strand:- start:2470 stop:2697 length:228 start_codon:yes stop_codon:yes gene_type:complete
LTYKRIIGIALGIASIISLVLLTFGYRDVSMELLGMFFLTLIGLPLSTYLITKEKTFMTVEEDDDVIDVVGRFSI